MYRQGIIKPLGNSYGSGYTISLYDDEAHHFTPLEGDFYGYTVEEAKRQFRRMHGLKGKHITWTEDNGNLMDALMRYIELGGKTSDLFIR